MDDLQAKLFENEKELHEIKMLLHEKTSHIRELTKSEANIDHLKNQQVKNLKEELIAKSTKMRNQNEKILKLQKLLAVREVLLHTLKMERTNS